MAGSQDPSPADPRAALERLGRLSLRDLSMEDLLQTVADLARSTIPGGPETSVCLLVRDRPTTVVSTGRMATALDEVQFDRGHGPCLHAARTGRVVEVADARTDDRWPDYLPHAVGHGSLSSLSIPLTVDAEAQVTGALNVYARRPGAFDEASRSVATGFGPYAAVAAVAAGNPYAYRSARDRADNLQIALGSQAVIDQAKGMLMERHGLTADTAFQVLARVSTQGNTKVRDVAEHLVRTGELPGP